MQGLAGLLLFGSPVVGIFIGRPGLGWGIGLGVLVLHVSELGITLPWIRQKNLKGLPVVIKTLLFGFTWWVPYQQGVFQE